MANMVKKDHGWAGHQVMSKQGDIVIFQGSLVETITPSDTDSFKESGIVWVGTGDDVAVMPVDNTTSVIFKNVPSGTLLPVLVKQVLKTGTKATNLLLLK